MAEALMESDPVTAKALIEMAEELEAVCKRRYESNLFTTSSLDSTRNSLTP